MIGFYMFIYKIALGGGCNYIITPGKYASDYYYYFIFILSRCACRVHSHLPPISFFIFIFFFFSLLCELQQFVFDASLLLLLLKLLTFLPSRSIGYYIILNELTFHIDLCRPTSRSMTRLLLHMR